ncbi:uncharacterized protein LOC125025828 [Penaeus chinensis]|uniref:uncharacterized protein LOC125025828 n=1 Tax=Penaeus chinensis TaxID=139456 RepID=UPI001FB57F3B|nr:uncharacterized protein LOC125025828 [Penaeus chinensis]
MNEIYNENEGLVGSDNNSENDNTEVDIHISVSSISDAEGKAGDEVWKMPSELVTAARPGEEAPTAQGCRSVSFSKGGRQPKNACNKKGGDENKVIPADKSGGSQGKNHQQGNQNASSQKNCSKNSNEDAVNPQYGKCKTIENQGTNGNKNILPQPNKNGKSIPNQQNRNNATQPNGKHIANQQHNNRSNDNQQNKNNNNNSSNNNNKNKDTKKKKDEGGGSGMFAQLKSILSPLVRRDDGTPEIVDSFVLRMHYSLGMSVFVLAFSIVQANWFTKEAIHCVFGYNADRTVNPAIKNTCLSYPYTCQPPRETVYGGEDCPRRYLMFYRWIHFSFLALAGIFYLPRMVAKKTNHSPLKKLLSILISMEERYDDSAFEYGVSKMVTYFENHFSVHGSLYTRLVMCHVIAVVIDVGSFIYLDFFMQENFIGLIYKSYPFHRNPRNFFDNLYQVFPPFVFCTINEYNLINNARVDVLHCHLMLMELYEKVFVVLWVLLAFLMVIAVVSLVVLLLIVLPPFNRVFLFTFTTSERVRKIKRKVHCIFGYGDLHVMSMMKSHVSEGQFITFLSQLVENPRLKFNAMFPSEKDGLIIRNDMEDINSITAPLSRHEPSHYLPPGTLQPDAVLTLPNDSLLPDLHCQNGSCTQGHTSSTPKPKSRLLPPFFKK